jgi:SDR family mycofactocin-dependent oxidoreductase
VGRLEGKVAFISGIGRGQGRSHALRLAEEGAEIIGFDLCEQIDTVQYPLATPDDLEATIKLVRDQGRGIVARQADVRDRRAVSNVLDQGLAEFGHVDIVLCNAGSLFGFGLADMSVDNLMRAWQDSLDVLLTGALNTIVAALPALMGQDTGGSIVITSSTAGLASMSGPASSPEEALTAIGYTAGKTGVIGLMRALAGSLAHLSIRVNTVHPTGVNTPFVVNDMWAKILEQNPGASEGWKNAMPVELIEPEDVSNAIVWLCSEEARYVTGIQLPVDAGFLLR